MAGVTRVGATKQYSDNWDNIFGGGKRRASTSKSADKAKFAGKAARKSPKKAAQGAKNKAGKKRAGASKRKGR